MTFYYNGVSYNFNENNLSLSIRTEPLGKSELNFDDAFICVIDKGIVYLETSVSLLSENENYKACEIPLYGFALPYKGKLALLQENAFCEPYVLQFEVKNLETIIEHAKEIKRKRDILESYLHYFLIFRHPKRIKVNISPYLNRFIHMILDDDSREVTFLLNDEIQNFELRVVFNENTYPMPTRFYKLIADAYDQGRIIDIE